MSVEERELLNSPDLAEPETFVFLLVEGFTHLALSSCVEVLRVANLLRKSDLYTWSLMAPGGHTQTSSNGLVTHVDSDLRDLKRGTKLYVVSGIGAELKVDAALLNYLRMQSRHGVEIGAICSGAYILAKAGLLKDQSCAVHWEYYPVFREKFPSLELDGSTFVARIKPFTASGGTAGAELMLTLISRTHGHDLASEIGDQLIMPWIRAEGDVQRMPNHIRYGTRNRILLRTLEYMQANVEEPLSTQELSEFVGVSVRQIERTFRKFLSQSPKRFYKNVRLEHARKLLATTEMSIVEIALACGFNSPSHFSKVFRAEFGETPYAVFKKK